MNNPQSESGRGFLKRKTGCGCVTFTLVGFLGVLLLSMGIGTGAFDVCAALLTGWLSFLGRVWPRIKWNFDLIAMGALCSAVALGLGHWLLRGLARSIGEARGKQWVWLWRWTWCGAVVMVIAFMVGMAVGGIAHQVGWIHSSPEPLTERKGRNWEAYADIRNLDMAVRLQLEEASNNVSLVRSQLWNPTNNYFGSTTRTALKLQNYQILLVQGERGAVQRSIIFPRDPAVATKLGGYVTVDGNGDWLPWAKLQLRLKELSPRLVSF